VRVEHALAGVKRSRIVKDVLRNTKESFSDLVMTVACGLHNLRVQVRKRRLKIYTILFRIMSNEVRVHIESREVKQAVQGIFLLLRYHPRGFVWHACQKLHHIAFRAKNRLRCFPSSR